MAQNEHVKQGQVHLSQLSMKVTDISTDTVHASHKCVKET